MSVNNYITELIDVTADSSIRIAELGNLICSRSKSGDFSCAGYDKMIEIALLQELITNYASCFDDITAITNILNSIVDTCAIVPNPIAPPIVEPGPCDDHSLLTERGLCIITEDDEIPVIHE